MVRYRRFLHLTLTILVVSVGLIGLNTPRALACSCPPPPAPDEAVENADYVFTGEVVDISDPDGDQYVTVRFTVIEAWKGVEHQEISVGTPVDSAACGYAFTEGREYLVYASENDGRIGPDLITGICNRTDNLSTASEDLMVLGTGTQADDLEAVDQTGDGLDLWLLFGGITLFLAIVVAITLLRRWR